MLGISQERMQSYDWDIELQKNLCHMGPATVDGSHVGTQENCFSRIP